MRAIAGERPAAWAALAAMGLLFFLVVAGTFTSLGVVLPAMVKEMGWSWQAAGFGFTLLALSTGLASYLPTLAIRRFGVGWTLVIGTGVKTAAFLLLAFGRTLIGYDAAMILAGIAFALTANVPGAFVLARAFHNPSRAFGVYFLMGGLGGLAGPWLYLAVTALGDSWRVYWGVLAGVSLVVGLIAALLAHPAAHSETLAPAPPTATGEGDWGVREALATPQFWIIVAAYTTYLLVGVTVNAVSVQHMVEKGFSTPLAGALLSLNGLVNALSRAAAGELGQRLKPKTLTVAALGLLALGALLFAVTGQLTGLALAQILVGAGYGVAFTATTVLMLNAFGREKNLELFSLMALISTAASVGPWLAGAEHDQMGGFSLAFVALTAISLAALAVTAGMAPPKRRRAG